MHLDRWLVLGSVVVGLGAGWLASADGDLTSVPAGRGAVQPLTDHVRGSSVTGESARQDEFPTRRIASRDRSTRQHAERPAKKRDERRHEKRSRPRGVPPGFVLATTDEVIPAVVVETDDATSPVTSGSPPVSGGSGGSGGPPGGSGGSGGSPGGSGGSGGSPGGSGGSPGAGTGGPDGDGGGGNSGGTDDGSGGTIGGGGGG